MACWNGLSVEQQVRLIEHGNLPLGYEPEGECQNPATIAIETEADEAPGPRFYCIPCASAFLELAGNVMRFHRLLAAIDDLDEPEYPPDPTGIDAAERYEGASE